tara:strand:- start:256 stop:1431 length:1176 start_codon:yes stop_codon:yes gene_type:complete
MVPYKQQNPLEFLLDANQKAGTAVLQVGADALQGAHSLLINNSVADKLADNLNKAVTWGVRNSIAGKADQAATKAGGDVSESLGGPRWLGEFIGGALIPGPSVGSYQTASDVVGLKINALKNLDKVSNEASEFLSKFPKVTKKNSAKQQWHDITAAKNRKAVAQRTKAFVLQSGEESPTLNLLGLPTGEEIVAGFNRVFQDIVMPLKKLNTPGHHIGMAETFAQPYKRMDLKKGLEVNKILTDKHNIMLGQEDSNLQTLYSQLIHNKVGHIGDTKDIHIRTAFKKANFEDMSPEQAADVIAKQYWVAQQQAWKASVHPVNVEAGWSIYNALPTDMKKRLPPGFNPLDPKDNREAYDQYRLLVNNLNPKIKEDILNATAKAELLWLKSIDTN